MADCHILEDSKSNVENKSISASNSCENRAESLIDKLQREAQVFLAGAASGAAKRLVSPENIAENLLNATTSYGLAYLIGRNGGQSNLAQFAKGFLGISTGIAAYRHLPEFLSESKEIWQRNWDSNSHIAKDQEKIANSLGKFITDSTISGVSGIRAMRFGAMHHEQRAFEKELLQFPLDIKNGIVKISTRNFDGPGNSTGFAIDRNTFVVSGHAVADSSRSIKISTLRDYQQVDAKLLGIHPQHDIALVRTSEPLNVIPLKLAESSKLPNHSLSAILGQTENSGLFGMTNYRTSPGRIFAGTNFENITKDYGDSLGKFRTFIVNLKDFFPSQNSHSKLGRASYTFPDERPFIFSESANSSYGLSGAPHLNRKNMEVVGVTSSMFGATPYDKRLTTSEPIEAVHQLLSWTSKAGREGTISTRQAANSMRISEEEVINRLRQGKLAGIVSPNYSGSDLTMSNLRSGNHIYRILRQQ